MWTSGLRFGRRRRRASAGAVFFFLAVIFGIEYARDEYQRRQEYSGTLVRRYTSAEYSGNRSRSLYWDIRSPDGNIHSPRIRPRSFWEEAHDGQHVIKKAGELYPTIVRW